MGKCLFLKPDRKNWRRSRALAVSQLVRPEETVGLVVGSRVEAVANWLYAARKSGRLRYLPDPRRADTWCSPAAFLASSEGDCSNFAILALSILRGLGIDAVAVVGRRGRGRRSGHVWIEGQDASGWFLLESTNGEVFRGTYPRLYKPVIILP